MLLSGLTNQYKTESTDNLLVKSLPKMSLA